MNGSPTFSVPMRHRTLPVCRLINLRWTKYAHNTTSSLSILAACSRTRNRSILSPFHAPFRLIAILLMSGTVLLGLPLPREKSRLIFPLRNSNSSRWSTSRKEPSITIDPTSSTCVSPHLPVHPGKLRSEEHTSELQSRPHLV